MKRRETPAIATAPGTSAQVQFGALRGALEEDASALAGAFSREQREKLGTADPPTPLDRAMWWDESAAWRKAELERARELAKAGHDSAKLADEVWADRRP